MVAELVARSAAREVVAVVAGVREVAPYMRWAGFKAGWS